MAQDDKKILSGALHISGTIYHIIVIYGTLVKNYEISRCFFRFFEILIIWVVRVEGGIKGKKMVQNEKNYLCHPRYLRNHTSYNFDLWYACVK